MKQMMAACDAPDARAKSVFNNNLITDDQLDSTPLKEVKEKTQLMQKAVDLQRGINQKSQYGQQEGDEYSELKKKGPSYPGGRK